METNNASYLIIKELSKYLRISYNKATVLAKEPSFSKVCITGNSISKAEITEWLEKRLK